MVSVGGTFTLHALQTYVKTKYKTMLLFDLLKVDNLCTC